MKRFFALAVVACVALGLLLITAGCKKPGGGDAAGKVIKDKNTGADISKPLVLGDGKGTMPTPTSPTGEAKAPAGEAKAPAGEAKAPAGEAKAPAGAAKTGQ